MNGSLFWFGHPRADWWKIGQKEEPIFQNAPNGVSSAKAAGLRTTNKFGSLSTWFSLGLVFVTRSELAVRSR
jgi:hypothetical protein